MANHLCYRTHEDAVIQELRDDPAYAAELLNAVLDDGDQEELMMTLRRIAKSFGANKLAEQAELNATTLYRTLSAQGNPELKTLTSMLKAMGLQLAFRPIQNNA